MRLPAGVWLLAILIVLAGARLSVWSYGRGHAAAEAACVREAAAAQARMMRAAETASRAEAARLAAEAGRDGMARALEDAAHADEDADRPALGARSVRRIGQR